MGRLGKERLGRPLLHHPTAVHDQHALAKSRHHAKIMGDEDRGHAEILLQIAQQVHDLRLHGHIKRGRRLIRDQQVGFAQQRHGDHHPLAHPAGELVRKETDALLRRWNFHRVEHPHRFRQRVALGHAVVQGQHLGHLVGDPHIGIERGHWVLKDHRDPLGADFVENLWLGAQNLLPVETD